MTDHKICKTLHKIMNHIFWETAAYYAACMWFTDWYFYEDSLCLPNIISCPHNCFWLIPPTKNIVPQKAVNIFVQILKTIYLIIDNNMPVSKVWGFAIILHRYAWMVKNKPLLIAFPHWSYWTNVIWFIRARNRCFSLYAWVVVLWRIVLPIMLL